MDAFSSVAHHNSLQLMQHEAVWSLPPQGGSEGPTFITRTAPISQRPITYLLIGLLSLFGTHAEAKSSDEHLTWADVRVRRLQHDAQRCGLADGRSRGFALTWAGEEHLSS